MRQNRRRPQILAFALLPEVSIQRWLQQPVQGRLSEEGGREGILILSLRSTIPKIQKYKNTKMQSHNNTKILEMLSEEGGRRAY